MKANVIFNWQNQSFQGWIEHEYQNSFLINVLEPTCEELTEKYANRLIISKKACQLL
ncbi:MAG: DUF2187 domain-containing protein [Enterococcus sp.]